MRGWAGSPTRSVISLLVLSGPRKEGDTSFQSWIQVPLLCLSLTVKETHQLNNAGQMPKSSCSCETFLNYVLTDNTLSKEQQTYPVPCRSEPKANSRSWEVFWVLHTPLLGSPPLPDSAYMRTPSPVLPLQSLIQILKTWTWTPSQTRRGGGPTAPGASSGPRSGEASLLLS